MLGLLWYIHLEAIFKCFMLDFSFVISETTKMQRVTFMENGDLFCLLYDKC